MTNTTEDGKIIKKHKDGLDGVYCGCCEKWLGIDGWDFKFCPFCGMKFEGEERRTTDAKPKHNTAKKAEN